MALLPFPVRQQSRALPAPETATSRHAYRGPCLRGRRREERGRASTSLLRFSDGSRDGRPREHVTDRQRSAGSILRSRIDPVTVAHLTVHDINACPHAFATVRMSPERPGRDGYVGLPLHLGARQLSPERITGTLCSMTCHRYRATQRLPMPRSSRPRGGAPLRDGPRTRPGCGSPTRLARPVIRGRRPSRQLL